MDGQIPKRHDENYAAACANGLSLSLDRELTMKGTMRTTKCTITSVALAGAIAVTVFTGSAALTTVHAADVSPTEARAIVKEAYIYGFPLVDTYRIQYGYFVDTKNPEFKAP